MNQDRYPFSADRNYLNFEFESDGPNGKIKKVVRFTLDRLEGTTVFSLAFGHLNEKTGELDDKTVSNNQDRTKILSTVAATVIEFTKHFPDIQIFAKGSNPARTRLYQMGISTNLTEIETILNIYGSKNQSWEPFQRNVNYEAFLARRKNK